MNFDLSKHQQEHLERALALHQGGHFQEAAALYEGLLDALPNFPFLLTQLGTLALQVGNMDRGIALLGKSTGLDPNQLHALFNLGKALLMLKRFDEALRCFDRALSIKPASIELLLNRGICLINAGRLQEAVANYQAVLKIHPDVFDAHNNLGYLLQDNGDHEGALACYERAIEINPGMAEAHNNKGYVLWRLRNYRAALDSLNSAIAINPDYSEAYCNRGNAEECLQKYDDALVSYTRAISINPRSEIAYSNRGVLRRRLGDHAGALNDFECAMEVNPGFDELLGNYLYTALTLCDWRIYRNFAATFVFSPENFHRRIEPFIALFFVDDPLLLSRLAADYVSEKTKRVGIIEPVEHPPHEKIKIGYFSADFHDHPTMHLMAGLFECHDRSQFELTAFSFGPDRQDPWRQRAVAGFDQFIDVGAMSDKDITQLARRLEIDIAVDLKGFTQDSRPAIFAARAAPIQVNYLGYPGTMGTQFMDYVIADQVLIPDGGQSGYAEKIVRLPNSYQVNDAKRTVSERRLTRSDVGLPENAFVFCCFNNTYKILPDIFDVWMDVLRHVENSVLWLFESHPTAADNLRGAAESRGVDGSRLIFARYMPIEDHLTRIPLADLFLDTFPYNAHTTASDALRTGVPLLTYAGQSFASRVAASLLNAVGLPELVTHSLDQYKAMALVLATQPEQLKRVRAKLLANLPSASLYDTQSFTRHLETAYRAMYARYRNKLAPDHIRIEPAE